MAPRSPYPVVIIGAGPAGLTAAYELVRLGRRPVVLEKGDKVGGLARTESYKGCRFDLGGHRFFSKSRKVNEIWEQLLGKDFLLRPRLSRIYYKGRFFNYPLKPLNVLTSLGVIESLLILVSYLRSQVSPCKEEETFEQWVTNRFGKRLYETFFRTYTEKVWGVPCSTLKAEWAAQRIKDLSLRTALLNMLGFRGETIKSLIEEFHYPRLGPGMMWEAVREYVEAQGGVVKLKAEVISIKRVGRKIQNVTISTHDRVEVIRGEHFISSMPVTELIKRLDPPALTALRPAGELRYRDFLTVCLIIKRADLFPDNWIYVHDPNVRVGRIQNFKNWSHDMVSDAETTTLGLEYFCSEGDDLWSKPDVSLVELGKREVERMGLVHYDEILDGCVFRVPKAYPIYDADYRQHLDAVRAIVDTFENCSTVGRNGLHRYNNQDHAMLTGILAVRNFVYGEENDLWNVNADGVYHEEILEESSLADQDMEPVIQEGLRHVFSKLDRVALGLSIGTAAGGLLSAATLVLVIKGGEVVGPNLQLLSQIFPGYRVTAWGILWGLGYGFVVGFLGGWGFAFFRNAAVFISAMVSQRRAERTYLRRILEYL